MQEAENPQRRSISYSQVLWHLPMFDNLFLSMQGQNVMLIDFFLRDQEEQLLSDLIKLERTPPQTTFVSAMSQMWIFAAYELLRTWRQSTADLKKQAARPIEQDEAPSGHADLAALYREKHLERFRNDSQFRDEIEGSYIRVESVFRSIEALRMNLAKHEVPKSKGELARAPGYARINHSDGSIYWTVDLGDDGDYIVSRRDISDRLREVVIAP